MDSPEPPLEDSSPNNNNRDGGTRRLKTSQDSAHEGVTENRAIFHKLDGFGLKVATNFRTKLHRASNETIKHRKFFKRVNGGAEEVDGVDVSKVLKLISKPVSEVFALKNPQKTTLKTYSNKRKHLNDGDGFILESFGLPDEPIVPLRGPVITRNTKIDVDVRCDAKDNLIVPYVFNDFNRESGAVEQFNLEKGEQMDLCLCSDLDKSVEAVEQYHTKENANEARNGEKGQAIDKMDKILKKKKIKLLMAFQNQPKRVLRSGIENNNEHPKGDANKNHVINPVKVALQIKEQTNQLHGDVHLVLNPFKLNLTQELHKGESVISASQMTQSESVKINKETVKFEVGDLAWAKIGSHPYWPCMLAEETGLGKHWKYIANRAQPYYHVRFFADQGRRSWVSGCHVMPFREKDDLEKMADALRAQNKLKPSLIKQSYVIKHRNLAKWKIGVEEAESLKNKSVEERLNYFAELARERRPKIKESAKQNDVVNGESPVVESTNISSSEEKRESPVDKNMNVSPTEEKKQKEEQTINEAEAAQQVLKKLKRFQRKEEFSEEALEARKKLRKLEPKDDASSGTQSEPMKKPDLNSSGEGEPNFPPTPPKVRSKQAIPNEHSDTDSKFSDISSVPASLESQAALYKRNNIFRGIPREKVCQICEKPGEVFKCKGPCSGVYHHTCGTSRSNDAAEEEQKQEVKDALVDDLSKWFPTVTLPPNHNDMTLPEKIDFRMKEIMKNFEHQTLHPDSSDMDESTLDDPKPETKLIVTPKPSKQDVPIIKHVTADTVNYICVTNNRKDKEAVDVIAKNPKCVWCASDETPRCFVCNKEKSPKGDTFRQKCSLHHCGKYYHLECLREWPQTQWCLINSAKDTFVCPHHVCHTCISDDPHTCNSRCPSDKGVKCLRCPSNYHAKNYCVPAGSEILSSTQIVCPRHFTNRRRNFQQTINTNWCFICSRGGNLICCETCPTSVHVECLPGDLNRDETFYCDDCQSGRLPLYDEIVWVKLGAFRWWPALILFPNEIPDKLRNIAHNKGEFVVKFFGTYDHYWVGRGRTFLFQEGDKGHSNKIKKRVDNTFERAIDEAATAHQLKQQFKLNKAAEKINGLKPPPYIRIKVNRPVGNVRQFDGNTSNTTSCDCDPNQPHPCGPDSYCLNRLLLTECNPAVCPAGERCNNQCFEKREYPPLVPHRTEVRGWGLKTLAPVRKGQFIIEYVGEIIDEHEFQRRQEKMHQQKEENYYFLTIDKDRMIDAGPKGNVARFMNHSCQPNCETQKWTVNGDTRVGLFAKSDIPADTELTFNYNLECSGKEKKICQCGAPNCSGFIGMKVKTDGNRKKTNKPRKKTLPSPPPDPVVNQSPCFVCGQIGDVGACNNKICTKYYHLGCVGLSAWPEGGKWVCHWHNCNFCTKRTSRCCVKCVNSYCPSHSQGHVRYDKAMGFVCSEHDPLNDLNKEAVPKEIKDPEVNQNVEMTDKNDSLRSEASLNNSKSRIRSKRRTKNWGRRKKRNTAKTRRVSGTQTETKQIPEGNHPKTSVLE